MASFNKIIMLGNLTRDPELKYLQNQTPVVDFGIATNRKWKANDGTQRDEVCFIDCRAFGKMAENLQKYIHKGDPLLIDGRLTFDQWEGKDGVKRNKHRIVLVAFTFVPRAEQKQAQPQGQPQGGGANPDYNENYVPPDDDVPF